MKPGSSTTVYGCIDVDMYMPIASVMFLALSVLMSRGGLKAAGISCCTKDVFFPPTGDRYVGVMPSYVGKHV